MKTNELHPHSVIVIIPIIITKSTLTCTNCGKTGHLLETCHNMKKKVPVVPTTIVKST
jgi:hypothetical protein